MVREEMSAHPHHSYIPGTLLKPAAKFCNLGVEKHQSLSPPEISPSVPIPPEQAPSGCVEGTPPPLRRVAVCWKAQLTAQRWAMSDPFMAFICTLLLYS